MEKESNRNKYTFGLGTFGRDMVYTIVSMYLMFYLTDVLELSTSTLWWITSIILCCRIFDALNDPIMGVIVDNTHTRFGKFKPWIVFGGITAGILTVLLFTDFRIEGSGYIILFGILYLSWGIMFTSNDISYWSMLPSLSLDQRKREEIGSVARICASLGMFIVVAGIVPITSALGNILGSTQKAYTVFAAIVVGIMWLFLCFTVFGVKEPHIVTEEQQHTTLKEMVHVIFGNDQLLTVAISMALFMIGYCTTTSFGLYYFKYAYGDEGMYSIFAAILGVSQITALVAFPHFSKKYERKQLYTVAVFLVTLGYLLFFFAPTNTMLFIGIAGILIFVGQAFIQIMMLMFLSDTVEYGFWKSGKRNESVTLAIQPFINKLGGAVGSGVVGATVILSGIKDASSKADVTKEGLMMMKTAMMILPLIAIIVGFVVYRKNFRIDKTMYERIICELKERGDIKSE